MGVFIRTLLVWLVVLAIPVQGAAAATMAFCGPGHHGSGPAAEAAGMPDSEHAHHAGVDSAHHFAADVSAVAVTADGASSTSDAGQDTQQKCSVCASCCSSSAMPPREPVVPAVEPAPAVFTTVVPTVDAFAADGPDRPPRSVLA